MSCRACTDHLEHCHGLSVVHADGTTECMGEGDGPCAMAHHLHDWRLPCTALDPPCPCQPEEELTVPGDLLLALPAAA